MARKKNSEFLISWMTVTYRSVAVTLTAGVLILAAAAYFAFPDSSAVVSLSGTLRRGLEKIGLAAVNSARADNEGSQAHFTNIDGTVRVKKANSNTWSQADYSVPLEKGDVVQTSSEGMAKVVFADGTSYSIKQDSLIVVEENSTNPSQQTQVAVQVTTGTVDLATASYSHGSRSEVRVAGASAALAPESSAMVHNNPREDQHEILLKKGSGVVTRGKESVPLSNWEKVSFRNDSQSMTRVKQLGPPTLIQPANMLPVYIQGSGKAVDFSWTPVPGSQGYRLRVSKTPYFSSTVFDQVLQGTQARLPSMKEGGYYWVVTSMDKGGKESVESERNQFTVVAKAVDNTGLALDLLPFVQHGHVIEIKGRTDSNARVMVNGQEVPMINGDGTFHFFTPPLPRGENIITITAQNSKGGVKTEQKRLLIE